MNTTAKVTASTLGTGGAVVVGCSVAGVFDGSKESVVEQSSTDISWSPLTSDTDFSSTYNTDNTAGKEYGRYLVGMDVSNQKWWEKAFKQYEQDKSDASSLHDIFLDGKVKPAYSSTDSKALNKVCEGAYKKTLTSEVDFSSTGSENKHKLAANILKYCSPLGKIPIVIPVDGESYNDNTIGKQGNAKSLVSVKESANDEFWKAQNKWFEGKGKSSSSLDTYFAQFFTGTNESKQLSDGKTIKQICEETYKKTAMTEDNATTDKPKIDDVAKYCSFSKETPN